MAPGAVCQSRAGGGTKGAMGTSVFVLHHLHPEQREGTASAAVAAAFLDPAQEGRVWQEVSTPKGTQ